MNADPRHSTTDSRGAPDEAVRRIMSEADDWRRLANLDEEKTVTVYLDLKSPHAYIALRPSLELARDYRVNVDVRPYTLSYTGLGISSTVEPDMRRRPPSPAADRRARMYYATAREYTALQGLPLRSPHRLLDSSLGHRVFLFAKRQRLEVPFAMDVYLHGWGSGWRDYELESIDALCGSLARVGGELTGVEAFVATGGPAEAALERCMRAADETGLVGIPHYVFHDTTKNRDVGLFGREHLALIRSKLAAEGRARSAEVRPEFSHAWRGPGT